MESVTTITPKYQVHIPAHIRKQIGLIRHGRARITTDNKKIIIEPLADDFLTLGGSFAVEKPTAADKIRGAVSYTDKK